MSTTESPPGDDFNLVGDKMELIMTDLVVITKKEKAPPKYMAVEPPISEGGRLSFSKRYFAYSREIPNPKWGRVAMTDIKVLPTSQAPVGYRCLYETLDDNSKPFSAKTIAFKLVPFDEATEAVTDLVVLTGSKKDQVPSGYKRLPEINGFSVCFQVTKLNKKAPPTASGAPPISTRPRGETRPPPEAPTYEKQISRKARSAIEGLNFNINDQSSSILDKSILPEMKFLTLNEIEAKFNFDWSVEEQAQG